MKQGKQQILQALWVATILFMSLTSATIAQSGGTTYYIYDNNGRLRVVLSPSGEAAVYDYDPAGNMTAIRRLTTNDFELFSFTPQIGAPGDRVTFYGVGISTGTVTVSFNGVAANVIAVSPIKVIAEVPPGATTGIVGITSSRGTVMTPTPFTIKGVGIIPTTATVVTGDNQQFTALVAIETGNQSVTWSVNGVDGGNTTVGTISTTGLYTAPSLPAGQRSSTFLVRATSVVDPSLFREAQVTVLNSQFLTGLFAAGVSIRREAAPATITSLSAYSPGVSIRREVALGTISSVSAYSPGVSIRREVAIGTISSVSAHSPGVSISTGPAITSLSPATLQQGTSQSITINGSNLTGATGLIFVGSNGIGSTNFTVTNITINPGGTTLTATVAALAGTTTGRYVVVVTGTAGKSTTTDIGTNILEITP